MNLATANAQFQPRLSRRKAYNTVFHVFCIMLSLICVLALGTLMARVLVEGWPYLTGSLITNYPSTFNPEASGMRHAIFGTFWLMLCCGCVSIPLGLGAAIFLNEYAGDTWLMRIVRVNIANLAGVPSIVYGILGLAIFVRWLQFDRTVVAGGLTLSLLVLPVIIIAAREALDAVPGSLREASLALGATKWQTIRYHVLPAALPGFLTGVILALSRAIGEAAPIMIIGAYAIIAGVPGERVALDNASPAAIFEKAKAILGDDFSAMPIMIYHWAEQPQDGVNERLAAAAIVVLLTALLTMNAVAVAIRMWQQRAQSR